jgi:hypothetical protein
MKSGLIEAYQSMIEDIRKKGIPQLAPKVREVIKPVKGKPDKKGAKDKKRAGDSTPALSKNNS